MSPQNAIRCVPTSPLVVKPQTKKVANRYQNTRVPAASRSVVSVSVEEIAGCGGRPPAPGRRRRSATSPIEDGRSGTSSQTSGSSAAVAIETAIATGFQPPCWASVASSGRKTSRPVAALADISPITSPRLVLNQRLTMVAPSTVATAPEPMPDSTPQVAIRCHGSVISRLSAVEPDIMTSAPSSVRRSPMRSISAAANGPARP